MAEIELALLIPILAIITVIITISLDHRRKMKLIEKGLWRAETEKMLEGAPAHSAAENTELVLKGYILGTEILTGKKAHAAEDSLVSPYHLKIILCGTHISRVHHEPSDSIHGNGPNKIFPHVRRPA